MKRKSTVTLGNMGMGIGMALMVGGIAYAIVGQLPELNLPGSDSYIELIAIFGGAIFWLAGARFSGRETVSDRYWWVKHFDKRCRRHS